MAQSAEQMAKMDEYRSKYESMTKRQISQNQFGAGTTHLPTWHYVDFLESALYLLEKKNLELRGKK